MSKKINPGVLFSFEILCFHFLILSILVRGACVFVWTSGAGLVPHFRGHRRKPTESRGFAQT